MRRGLLALLCIGILTPSLFLSAGCGGSPTPVGPVTVTPATSTVDGTDTLALTATVANDQNADGVTWSTSAGTLSGTSTTAATITLPAATSSSQTVTITATSVASPTATPGTSVITVPAKPAVTSSATPPVIGVGASVLYTLTASGGIGPYTWTLTSGSLPSCLQLASSSGILNGPSSTGVISGTATASCVGTFTPTFTVTDSGSPTKLTATQQVTFVIVPPAITFPSSLPGASVGTAYSASAAAAGAIGTTTYVLASGALPASGHLTLNPATGAITGTPYAADAGTYTFTVNVSDQYGDTATSGSLSITVTAPTITLATPTATAAVGTAYSSSAAATGTVGTTTYAIASGALPASGHLTLNAATGAISGTPYAADAGTSTFTIKVTDQYGDTATSGSLSINITAPTITFATPTATANVGVAYSSSAAASSAVGTTTYSIAGGALPASGHLAFDTSTGAISGTPFNADAGPYTFKVSVTDQYGDTATSGNLSITVVAPTITFPSSLPGGSVGTAYSASVAATGAVGTATYTLNSGALPASGHLTLTAGTGAISGTPYAADAGTATFTIKVTDQYGDTATSGSLSINITAPAITFATPTPTANVGVAYSSSAAASGTVGTTTYSIVGGALPASGHLAFDTGTGALAGTPFNGDKGTSTFTVKVVDQYGDTATSGSLSINVIAPTITLNTNLPAATVGTAYAGGVTASGTVGTTTYALSGGALGASGHLTLNSSTGAITGTPYATDAGTSIFAVSVTDQYGDTAGSFSENLVINAASPITFGAAPTSTATDGVTYSSAVTASGGAGALTYSLVSSGDSNLPSNFALNPGTGAVSGAPANLTSFTFDVQATDAYNDTPATQSYTVTVSPGAASKLVFSTEPPANGTAASPFGAEVQVEDVNGFLATSSTASVTITSTASGVQGTTTVAAVGGVVTFTNLLLNTSGAYTLTAAASGLSSAGSSGITIGAGTASKLVFATEPPANGTAATPFGTVVQVEDANNNLVTTSNASVTITSTAAGVTGTTTVAAIGGVATFPGLQLNTSGAYTLTAASPGVSSANSTGITIGAGTATNLFFITEPPTGGAAGVPFGAAVQVQDANGNLVTSSTASVTITSTAEGVTGTTAVSAVNGVANFTNLIFNTSGSYTLTAASPGLASPTSTIIAIGAGIPSKVVFTTQPPANGTAATPFSAVAQIEDGNGNLVTSSTASVTITSMAAGVTGTTTVAAAGGEATFSTLVLNTSGSYTLTAASPGLTSGNSSSITIAAGMATQLVFTAEPPANGSVGTPFGATVQVQDANNNLVTSSAASVTITSTASGVTGTLTVAAVGGVANFTDLILNTTGTYTLQAASPGLTGAGSSGVTVTETPTSVTGTAAVGSPIAGATVTLEDSAGHSSTATTASDGSYTLSTTGFTPPFLIQVQASSVNLYSVSADALTTTTINTDTFTDLIVRSWYGAQGINVDAAFASPSSNPAPAPASVQILASAIGNIAQLWLTHAGVDTSTFNLISTPFAANGTGIDLVLDYTTVNSGTGVVTITDSSTNASNPTTQTTTITFNTTAGTMTVATSTTNSNGASTSTNTTIVPALTPQQTALNSILATLTGVVNTVNSNGNALTAAELAPSLAADLLSDSLNQAQYAASLATVLRGVTLPAAQILAVKSIDPASGTADVVTNLTPNQNAGSPFQTGEFWFENSGGTWLIGGDKRIALVGSQVANRNHQGCPVSTCGGSGGSGVAVSAELAAPDGALSSVTITDASGVTGWNAATVPEGGLEIFAFQPTPATTLDVDLRQFDNGWLGLGSATIPAGTVFTYALTPVSGPVVDYTWINNASTTESIAITSPTSGSLSSYTLDQPMTVTWTLPTTFPIAGAGLGAEVYTSWPVNSSTVQCEIAGSTTPPPGAGFPTSGTITIPSMCNGSPVVFMEIEVGVEGINGEIEQATVNVIGAGLAASQLVFTSEPPLNVTDGTPFSATVQVEDANNILVTGSNASVTITSTAPGVTGATTVAAVGGVAAFNNLIFNSSATYTLQANASGLNGVSSTNVTASNALAIQQTFSAVGGSGIGLFIYTHRLGRQRRRLHICPHRRKHTLQLRIDAG